MKNGTAQPRAPALARPRFAGSFLPDCKRNVAVDTVKRARLAYGPNGDQGGSTVRLWASLVLALLLLTAQTATAEAAWHEHAQPRPLATLTPPGQLACYPEWAKIELALRLVLTRSWASGGMAQNARQHIPWLLAERNRLRWAGWFN